MKSMTHFYILLSHSSAIIMYQCVFNKIIFLWNKWNRDLQKGLNGVLEDFSENKLWQKIILFKLSSKWIGWIFISKYLFQNFYSI
jgi:hypothetical protein